MDDTGSWVLVSRTLNPYTKEATERWCGLSRDLVKLPKTGTTGSTACCVDTGDCYMYERTTDRWYLHAKQQTEGGGSTEGEPYVGDYKVTPKAFESQTLPTAGKLLRADVVIAEIPYAEVSNTSNGVTATIASGAAAP